MNLMESYKGRLAIAESYYAQKNSGQKLSNTKKMLTAQCLSNVANFMNESFISSTSATQRADMGQFKKFCLDITTLTVPNLVINDMFMVKPMSSFSGYVTYLNFSAGIAKGTVKEGDVFSNPFTLGTMSEGRIDYSGVTGGKIVETIVGSATAYEAVEGTIEKQKADGTWEHVTAVAAGDKVRYIAKADIPAGEAGKTADLPTLNGKMEGIALTAKARRLAINYSQFAAYQAKQDYGLDFESVIAQQAQAELSYEVDSEAVYLVKNAFNGTAIEWEDQVASTGAYISYSQKAESFARTIEEAKNVIYKKTGRFMPTWILISPEVMPVLTFVPGFVPAANAAPNGPYVAGTVSGMKVIVSPALADPAEENAEGVCYLGVLGADGLTCTGVYAPYLPMVPTQLLGFADGTMSQGLINATAY